jgi:alkylation response protein AidB-like acyl-CoA dehydrogenase
MTGPTTELVSPALTLDAVTEPGARLVAICADHMDDFRTRAAEHDREGSFPTENFDAMRASGVLAATVPTELGGFGVTSIRDLVAASSRIARGDASTAIGLAMHTGPAWSLARAYRQAAAPTGLEGYLRLIAEGVLVLCGAGTESGTHTRFPKTEAVPTAEGWLLTGDKIFATLSPIATAFHVFCRTKRPDGGWASARAWVPRDSPGLEIVENWDALGMRASGSHALRIRNCLVPDELVSVRDEWGEWSAEELAYSAAGNLALLATYLGIAEEARDLIRATVLKRRKAPSDRLLADRHAVQDLFARLEIHLLTCRSVMDRVSVLWDAYLDTHADSELFLDDTHQLMAEYQCAKAIVERNAIAAVDLAMTLSGGAGYLSANPLSRLYRDVRAGPFMQPFSPVELYEYVGKVRLGREPSVDL